MTLVKAGTQVQARALVDLVGNAEITDAKKLVTAVAICLAESEGYDKAYNDVQGGRKVGLWQIKITTDQVGEPCEDALYEQKNNAAMMSDMLTEKGWSYWDSFTNKTYLNDTYIQRASLGVCNFLAEMLVEQAKAAGKTPVTRVPMITLGELNKLYRR